MNRKFKSKSRSKSKSNSGASTQDLVWGRRPVEEFLEMMPQSTHRIIVSKANEEFEEIAQRYGIQLERRDVQDLDELTQGGNHQGVVLETAPFEYAELEDVLEQVESEVGGLIVILDQVQDVGNLGAILRSAAAFGALAVVIPTRRAAQVTAAVTRASAGQAWRVPVVRETNLVRVIEKLQENQFWVASTGVTKEKASWTPSKLDAVGGKLAVVLGGEHGGVRRLVRERCDMEVHIPMREGVESLNVSVSAALLMYEAMKKEG